MRRLLVLLLSTLAGPMMMGQPFSVNSADSLLKCGRYDQAIQVAGVIASEAESSGDFSSRMRAWCIMGQAYLANGDEEKAREYCCKCYSEVAKSRDLLATPDMILLSASLSSTAKIYKENGEFEEAIKYLRRSIKFEKDLKRGATAATRYNELTEILIAQGKYDEALACIDTAKSFTPEKMANGRIGSIQSYNTGLCMEALGDSLTAEKYFREAEEKMSNKPTNDFMYVPIYLSKLASYAMARGDRDAALEYYERVLKNETKNLIDLSNYIGAYKALSELYAEEDPELSAEYAAKADSISYYPDLHKLADQLALINIDFPRKEREQVIRVQRLRTAFLGSLLLLLAVIIVGLMINNRSLKKLALMQEEQNDALRKANARKDELLEVSKSIADEHIRDEVSRIASEIGGTCDVKLTKRESEIAALVAQGMLNKEIADHLHISIRTVEFHRNALYHKFGVNNAVELMNCLNAAKKET